MPSSDELLLRSEDSQLLDTLLLEERDRVLLSKLQDLHSESSKQVVTVGVLYGAWHMRNVIQLLLDKLDYKIENAEWITVFDL